MEVEAIDLAFERELELELRMVREAVLLVAAGGSRRVIVANLQHGRVIAEPARIEARDAGLRVEILATPDVRRVDIAIERVSGVPEPTSPERPPSASLRLGVLRSPG